MQIDDLLREQLTDPEFKAAYEAEGVKLSIAIALGQAREAAGLTKKALAKKPTCHWQLSPELSKVIIPRLPHYQSWPLLWIVN